MIINYDVTRIKQSNLKLYQCDITIKCKLHQTYNTLYDLLQNYTLEYNKEISYLEGTISKSDTKDGEELARDIRESS